jgi:hypothetical protein
MFECWLSFQFTSDEIKTGTGWLFNFVIILCFKEPVQNGPGCRCLSGVSSAIKATRLRVLKSWIIHNEFPFKEVDHLSFAVGSNGCLMYI